MIPPELLPLISSHLLFASATPTVFEMPCSFTLDHLLSSSSTHHRILHPEWHPTSTVSFRTWRNTQQFQTRSRVTGSLQAAINGSFTSVPLEGAVKKEARHHPPPISRRSPSTDLLPSQKLVTMKHSNASSISLSLSLSISDPSSRNALLSGGPVSSYNDFEIIQ